MMSSPERTTPEAGERCEVLVALLPEPRDLEIARERGWYRVRPLKRAARLHRGLRQFTDIAFYQPDSFRSDPRCIRYYAGIRHISQARRSELLPEEPEHPRAQLLYLRFDLGPLEELPRPIPAARGRRLLFIRTSWVRIALAEEINVVFVGSPLEELLYRRLRAMGAWPEREFYLELKDPRRKRGPRQHYFLDFAVFCRDRDLDIETDGDRWHSRRGRIGQDNERDNLLQANRWQVLRFNTPALTEQMEETVSLVRESISQYGGVRLPDPVAGEEASSPLS